MRNLRAKKLGSHVFYRGPSVIDGSPIVGLAIMPSSGRGNTKTGAAMVQTYILADAGLSPVEAVRAGADVSICGECPHRGNGTGKARTCYVQLQNAPTAIYKALQRGSYPDMIGAVRPLADRLVRLGAYGDPAAIPAAVWDALLDGATDWTGYTHQWQAGGALEANALALQRYVLASADTEQDRCDAKPAGWRTFRVLSGSDQRVKGEAACPASKEMGARLQCSTCMACNGTASGRRGDIAIQLHGGTAVMAAVPALALRLL